MTTIDKYNYLLEDIINIMKKEYKNALKRERKNVNKTDEELDVLVQEYYDEFVSENTLHIIQDNKPNDIVICDRYFERMNEEIDNNQVNCTNFRAVVKDDNGQHKFILKISSSAINVGYKKYDGQKYNYNPTDGKPLKSNNLKEDFFKTYCNNEDINLDDYNLEPNKVVYYNTAYPFYTRFNSDLFRTIREIYNSDLESSDETIKNNAVEKIKSLTQEFRRKYLNIEELYKSSSRSVMLYTSKLLRDLGYETIITYPSPGFIINTIHKNDQELKEGLVSLYESFGFRKINCKEVIGNYFTNNFYDAKDYNMGYTEYIKPNMIGKLDDMIKQLDSYAYKGYKKIFPVLSYLNPIVKKLPSVLTNNWVGNKISKLNDTLKHDKSDKFIAKDEESYDKIVRNKKIFSEEEFNQLVNDNTNRVDAYMKKYLKYKQKYLELKKINDTIL